MSKADCLDDQYNCGVLDNARRAKSPVPGILESCIRTSTIGLYNGDDSAGTTSPPVGESPIPLQNNAWKTAIPVHQWCSPALNSELMKKLGSEILPVDTVPASRFQVIHWKLGAAVSGVVQQQKYVAMGEGGGLHSEPSGG